VTNLPTHVRSPCRHQPLPSYSSPPALFRQSRPLRPSHVQRRPRPTPAATFTSTPACSPQRMATQAWRISEARPALVACPAHPRYIPRYLAHLPSSSLRWGPSSLPGDGRPCDGLMMTMTIFRICACVYDLFKRPAVP
jgi:hypothetical protein